MEFKLYNDAREFIEDTGGVLSRHAEQNHWFFYNKAAAAEREGGMEFMSVKDGRGNVLLTALLPRPFPLLIYETDNMPNSIALKTLVSGIAGNNIGFEKIGAVPETAKRFVNCYCAETGKSFVFRTGMTFYRLDELKPFKTAGGALRNARKEDFYFLPYWLADFAPACRIGEYNFDEGMKQAAELTEAGSLFVWEVNGVPSAMAVKQLRGEDFTFVNYVYTPPHLRGRGCGKACVGELCRRHFESGGEKLYLYADRGNPVSNKIYLDIGFRPLLERDEYVMI